MLNGIRYFQSVVRNKSFTKAAEECYLSQSAISQQIQSLENEIGVKLLDRKHRAFSLTKAGDYFYRQSLDITRNLDSLLEETRKIGNRASYSLRIGVMKTLDPHYLILALRDFNQKYPKIKIQLTASNHEDLAIASQTLVIDIMLADQRKAFSQTFNNVELYSSPVYIELSENSPLSSLSHLDSDLLKQMPCIIISNHDNEGYEKDYYLNYFNVKTQFLFADNLSEARLMVASNMGFLPLDGCVSSQSDFLGVKRVPFYFDNKPMIKRYYAYWSKDNSGYYIEDFVDLLKEEIASEQKNAKL